MNVGKHGFRDSCDQSGLDSATCHQFLFLRIVEEEVVFYWN